MNDYLPVEAKQHLKDELQPARNRGFYICPLCGSGTGKGHGKADGALKITPDGMKWHCFSCNEGGDILDLLEKRDHVDQKEARQIISDRYGIAPAQKPKVAPVQQGEKLKAQNAGADANNYINACAAKIGGSDGEEYLTKRGLTPDTLQAFRIGYDAEKKAVVIPYPATDYYTTRSISGKEYRKPAGIAEPLFITGDPGKGALFICEGQIDALSLVQAGATAAAAIGGAGAGKLESMKPIKKAVIVRDNDDAGENTAQRIKEALTVKGVRCIIVQPPAEVKDANELLQKDPARLSGLVIEWAGQLDNDPDNISDYLQGAFSKDLARFQSFKDRKTGFSNIDEITSLYPGLYVIGAISSLGKTTFAHQLADQLAGAGDHVLYFSLEQNRLEMVSKGISRLTARQDIKTAVSAIDIRRGSDSEAVKDAIAEYSRIAAHEYMIECNFDTTIDSITGRVKEYMQEEKEKPVVIVDYLQIIRPQDPKQSTKDAVDGHVRALKKLQSENDLVLLVISSLNRMNYLTPVDFESFKESGGIEYTADVIWGLQLQIMNGDIFDKKDKLKEKREKVKAAKLENPRKIELVCLKNRYGRSSYSCGFNYYPQFDLFIPESDFTPAPDDFNPFEDYKRI